MERSKAPTWNSSSCSWWVSVLIPIPVPLRFEQNLLHSCDVGAVAVAVSLSFRFRSVPSCIQFCCVVTSVASHFHLTFFYHTHIHPHAHPIFLFCFALSPSAVFCCIELLFGLLLPVLSFCFYKFLVFWSPLEVWFTWGSGVGFDFSFFVFLLILIDYCCHFWKWIVGVCVWVWFGWWGCVSQVWCLIFFQMIV